MTLLIVQLPNYLLLVQFLSSKTMDRLTYLLCTIIKTFLCCKFAPCYAAETSEEVCQPEDVSRQGEAEEIVD